MNPQTERIMSMQRKTSSIPFVGLHAHSVASVFDGLGYPQDHMDFAYSNGMDALALTDHGNMNGLAYQVLHAKKMEKEGKDFKPIFGVEAYFIPSISDWRKEYDRIKEERAKSKSKAAKLDSDVSGATVEDEGETKKAIKSKERLISIATRPISIISKIKRMIPAILTQG